METEANGPFRWIPRSRKSKNDRKAVRTTPPLQYLHAPGNPVHTITITTNPIVHGTTGSSRCPKATQVPTPTVVCRTVCVCVGK